MSLSEEKRKSIIKLYEKTDDLNFISKETMVSTVSIRKILKKEGLFKLKIKNWTQEEIDFVKNNYSKFGADYCATSINRSFQSISTFAKNNDLKRDKIEISKMIKLRLDKTKKYKIKSELFFNIQSPEEAYVLGILWADGSLRNGKKGDNVIRVVLKSEDALDIRGVFFHSGNWSEKQWTHNQNKNLVTKYACCDKELYDFLINLDYHNKSYVSAEKVLLHIPENLRHYWWRGYFDGDGNITICSKYVSITSSYDYDWSFLKFLPKSILFSIRKGEFKSKNEKICKYSRVTFSTKNAKLFLDYIYKGKDFGIKRKKYRYLNPLKVFYKKGKRLSDKELIALNLKFPT
jgi:hypothetical protein